jgi:hypothetical protein
VFLKLEVSWVLAASPIKRCFGPNATNDLHTLCKIQYNFVKYYVRCSAIGHFVDDDIDTSMSGDSNLEHSSI